DRPLDATVDQLAPDFAADGAGAPRSADHRRRRGPEDRVQAPVQAILSARPRGEGGADVTGGCLEVSMRNSVAAGRREADPDLRARPGRAFDLDRRAVLLDDAPHDGHPETRALLLPFAEKRLEDPAECLRRHPASGVGD